ncbi:MAG TPA: tetratricopeptide repeat protein, partial [Gemmataceae bacterium]|nr:tetratricopeptide repeat protein [Gemmataceae bacterium]
MNLSFLLCLLLSFVVLSIGVVTVHAFQVKRNAEIFKRQAKLAVENKRYAEAAMYYGRYLNYVPADADARVQWAQALEKKTVKSKRDYEKAIELYGQVLHGDGDNRQIRRRLVQLCMMLRHFNDAQEHLKVLLDNSTGENGELEQWSALCYAETKNFPKAKQYYDRAIKHAPSHIASYPQLATILDDEGEHKKADEVMKQLVQRNEPNYEAHLFRARFL